MSSPCVLRSSAPYRSEDVAPARARLQSLEGRSAGPADLAKLGDVREDADHLTVIRRRDVMGLFDTTADLSGSYLDVSQYVRGDDERDVSVYWRERHQTLALLVGCASHGRLPFVLRQAYPNAFPSAPSRPTSQTFFITLLRPRHDRNGRCSSNSRLDVRR